MTVLPTPVLTALLGVELAAGPLDEVLQRLVHISRDALTGADEVSTTLVRDDRAFTAAYTGQLAMDADELQYQRGYGPCIDAGVTGTVLLIDDTRTETRWPDYTARVSERGVASSLSLPLPVQTQVVGALNCYSRSPRAFTPGMVQVGLELAGHLGVAIANAVSHADALRIGEDMRAAMASRAVIEQAKGVIMAQSRCSPEQAFAILSRASQSRNRKLRDVAQDLVTGVSGAAPSEQP